MLLLISRCVSLLMPLLLMLLPLLLLPLLLLLLPPQPVFATQDARSKKGAESAAAESIYRQLVAEGWWDPAAPPKPKKPAGVVSLVWEGVGQSGGEMGCGEGGGGGDQGGGQRGNSAGD
jgi:hypothetical protein